MCKVTVILCSAKRSWCYPWCTACCPLRHLLGRSWMKASHKSLLSGHAVGMSHHLGALDSRAQHAPPSSCWGPVIHSNWEQLLSTLLQMFSWGEYVNTSFHVSKAKAKDRVIVTACLYIISWVCQRYHMLCHLYLTSMMCAPQHLVFCNTQCGFHYVSLTPSAKYLLSGLLTYCHWGN